MISDRYIAIMDILGFREMVRKQPLPEIVRIIEQLFDEIAGELSSSWAYREKDLKIVQGVAKVGKAHFSDTLILWTCPLNGCNKIQRDAEESNFFWCVTKIMLQSFLIGLPLRVGIGFGESYIDEATKTILGQAVIDAYLVESAQEWIGGALHPNCPVETLLDGTKDIDTIVRYPVPVKAGIEMNLEWALDWTEDVQISDRYSQEKYGFSYQQRLKETFTNYMKPGLPQNVYVKYKNAQLFADIQIEHGLRRWTEMFIKYDSPLQ